MKKIKIRYLQAFVICSCVEYSHNMQWEQINQIQKYKWKCLWIPQCGKFLQRSDSELFNCDNLSLTKLELILPSSHFRRVENEQIEEKNDENSYFI